MVQFSIRPEEISIQVNKEMKLEKELDEICCGVQVIKKNLHSELLIQAQIQSRLQKVINELNVQAADMRVMKDALSAVLEKYEDTEKRILLNAETADVEKDNLNGILESHYTVSKVEVCKAYFEEFSEYIRKRTEGYIDAIQESDSWPDVVVTWYDWFKGGLLKDFKNVKSLIEDVVEDATFKKPDLLPDYVDDFLDTLSKGELFIDITKELKEYYKTGDGWKAYGNIGFSIFGEAVKTGFQWLDKMGNLKYKGTDKCIQKVLTKIIIDMPKKWINEVIEAADGSKTSGEVWTNAVIGTAVEAIGSSAKPYYKAATAVSYPILDQICEAVGYDLSAEYEKLTGKKGLDAVFAAQKELWVDIVYEGAKDRLAEGIDNFYNSAEKVWNCWNSGVHAIFG